MSNEEMYLDYVNNFTTVEGFASYYGYTNHQANFIINNGRALHEYRVNLNSL